METKTLVWLGLIVGSTIGGALPMFWGGGFFSLSAIFLSGVGGLIGIWAGWKFSGH